MNILNIRRLIRNHRISNSEINITNETKNITDTLKSLNSRSTALVTRNHRRELIRLNQLLKPTALLQRRCFSHWGSNDTVALICYLTSFYSTLYLQVAKRQCVNNRNSRISRVIGVLSKCSDWPTDYVYSWSMCKISKLLSLFRL